MQFDSAFLKRHIEYSRWASLRVLEAARALSHDELDRNLGNSFGGVLSTLEHIFIGDRIWLSRLAGAPRFTLKDEGEQYTLVALEAAWRQVLDGFVNTASGLDPDSMLRYRSLQGGEFEMPVWQIIFHVVNHGTHHRGQVVTLLRQLGKPAPTIDMHVFYQEAAAAAGR